MVLLQCLPTVHAGAVTFAGPFAKGGWDVEFSIINIPL